MHGFRARRQGRSADRRPASLVKFSLGDRPRPAAAELGKRCHDRASLTGHPGWRCPDRAFEGGGEQGG
jgi:hypothetical protein